jgi:hypothetical protein
LSSTDAIIVSAWDGCVARIYDKDGQLINSVDIPVPDFIAYEKQKHRQAREAR